MLIEISTQVWTSQKDEKMIKKRDLKQESLLSWLPRT